MKKSLAAVSALVISASLAMPAQSEVPESEEPIKFMIGDWTSIALQAEIMSLILQTHGYNTTTVVADDSGRYPGFEAGDLHVAMETWQTTQQQNFAKSLATGKVLDMGETGLQGKEDWWYPIYMKDQCPGLPNWEALKDCGELFSTADTAPKGRYVGGPVTWGGFDEERIEALELPFEVIHPGTDAAMFAELKAAYEREAPIIMWVWIPHWAPSLYDGEFVEFPKYEDACYEDASWGVNPDKIADCGKPTGWIKKMAWAGGEEVWPCAYEMIRNYEMDNDTLSTLLAEVDLEGRSMTEVATEWLQANRSTWEPWTACAQ
ncbi:MAG: ABC transporter substrate-binding protein [Pseudomonadota bacterium]